MENVKKLSAYADDWVEFATSKLTGSPFNKIQILREFGKWSSEMYESHACKQVRTALGSHGAFLLLAAFAYECHQNWLATLTGTGVAFWAANTPGKFSVLKNDPLIRDNRDCAVATLLYFGIRPFVRGITHNFLIGVIGGYAIFHWKYGQTSNQNGYVVVEEPLESQSLAVS